MSKATAKASPKTQRVIEFKSFGEDGEGSFSGLLSPYGVVDMVKDRVMHGAFTKTIKDTGGSVPLLFQHLDEEPIGTLTLIDTPDGLQVKGQLLIDPDVPTAMKAYKLIKNGVIKSLSIGFQPVKADARDDKGVRNLREIKLWEGSIVTFPAATEAQIYQVKSVADGISDFDEEFSEMQALNFGWQAVDVLEECLIRSWWAVQDGCDNTATRLYVESVLAQFSKSFLAGFDRYASIMADGDPDDMKSLQLKSRLMYMESKKGRRATIEVKTPVVVEAPVAPAVVEPAAIENKAGKKVSADTAIMLKNAHEQMKSAGNILEALYEGSDDSATADSTKTLPPAAETKNDEPATSHSSGYSDVVESFRRLIANAAAE